MADILIDNQTASSTPASGKTAIFVDSTTKKQAFVDDSGIRRGGILSRNSSTAAQGAIATTEVYLTNSGLLVPSWGLDAGCTMIWYISAVKTGAGVAAPVWTWRIGTNQSTADTSRLALTATGAQVGTAMDGTLIAMLHVRTSGASGVLAGSGGAGPANFGGGGSGASSAVDLTSTIAGQYVGLTVTTGASAAWTINAVSAVMFN